MSLLCEERLISKKNKVYKREYLIDGEKRRVIEKEFNYPNRYRVEKKVIEILEHSVLAVPRLLPDKTPGQEKLSVLAYEYIEGITALDFIEQNGTLQCKYLLNEIIHWLADYYLILEAVFKEQWILGDAHLRNFIYHQSSDTLYGFDFENACPGRIEQDIARLFLFIITYDPAYSPKHSALAEYLIGNASQAFSLDKAVLTQEINKEARDMARRRGVYVDELLLSLIVENNFKSYILHNDIQGW